MSGNFVKEIAKEDKLAVFPVTLEQTALLVRSKVNPTFLYFYLNLGEQNSEFQCILKLGILFIIAFIKAIMNKIPFYPEFNPV